MSVIYLAGPMRNIPFFNFPKFDRVAGELRKQGHTVLNPADLDRERGFDAMKCPPDTDWSRVPAGFDFDACVREDVECVLKCDAVYMLKGWHNSKGATAEKALAEWRGKQVMHEESKSTAQQEAAIEDCLRRGLDARPRGTSIMPADSKARLDYPLCTGLLMYFPRACAAVARHSKRGNDQHNPGEKMHWAKEKSIGHGDQVVRHLIDGLSSWEHDREEAEHHFAGMAWRSLELLERFLAGYAPFAGTPQRKEAP